MTCFYDGFISYGRADSRSFAERLRQRLTQVGLQVWFDFEDIPLGVDYQKQIDDGIDQADNFLFIISPHAVNSPYCELEIELALKRGKRIIPILHVESIDRETWQTRNPQGTDADWEQYQQAGKHTCYANMHPTIRKINWIFFREGIDAFEAALQNLLALMNRDADYVRQHTVLLNQALGWEQSHRTPQMLLFDTALHQAETWLHTQFSDRQPPCSPTRLQCQYISESLKQAQNGMTEVFLSYAEADRAPCEQIYESLIRAGLTVWSSAQDIQTGIAFEAAINQGIEAADNLVYLVSSASLQSQWCQRELAYARTLNKRIIPILIEAIAEPSLPDYLQAIQFIAFTEDTQPSDYAAAEGQLLRVLRSLRQEANYHKLHKLLLVKALKWERQRRNASILLRGYNLQKYAAWLPLARQHPQHPPTPLQEVFMAASLAQPPGQTLAVFISYAPNDFAFARKLNDTLEIQSKTTWFEPEAPASDVEFQQGRRQAMALAENVLLIISPEALEHDAWMADWQYARQLNKRIIPVHYRKSRPESLPETLTGPDSIDFCHHDSDFLVNFGELFRILESDPVHVKGHTRLLAKAIEWQEADREDGYLLRGQELAKATAWLAQATDQRPPVTDLHRDYIQTSQALRFRKIKLRTVGLISAAVTVGIFLGRAMGLGQGLELAAYDHLLRLRPSEAPDDRFLLVLVDEADGRQLRGDYGPGWGTIPDPALEQALTLLEQAAPRLVALDFYRDFPAQPTLATRLQQMDTLIVVCKNGIDLESGVPGPAEVPPERIAFSDFVDDGDRFLRRHLLKQTADPEDCPYKEAFSLLLARQYLAAEGMPYQDPWAEAGRPLPLQLGAVSLPELYAGHSGGYKPDNDALAGYQTLLNYREYQGDPRQFAESVSLTALLNQAVAPEQIRDRIVMIGYTDTTDRNADTWNTPYGEMPGVMLQAQMTSQLISAAMDDRPLIWWWSVWLETGWIFGWSTVGGLVFWGLVRPARVTAASAGSAIGLYGLCYGVMVGTAGWIPLVPAAIGWLATGSLVALLTAHLRRPNW